MTKKSGMNKATMPAAKRRVIGRSPTSAPIVSATRNFVRFSISYPWFCTVGCADLIPATRHYFNPCFMLT